MKVLLNIVFILYSFNAFSFGIPFIDLKKDDPKEENSEVVEKECDMFKPYHFKLNMTLAEKENVYYVFLVSEGKTSQVGIIDEVAKKIFRVHNLKKIDRGYGYIGESSHDKYIEDNFPNLTELEYFLQR